MNVADKTVIVTGAARGIGRGIAETFVDHGARVVLVDVDEDAVRRAADGIGGDRVVAQEADVADLDGMESVARAAAERFGGVDVVCANAGIYPSVGIDEMSEAEWDRVQEVNLKGAFVTVKACLPYLKESGPDGFC